MDKREILEILFTKVKDKILIRHRILDSFYSRPNGMTVESFFYQYQEVIDDITDDFNSSKQKNIEDRKSSIDYNIKNFPNDESAQSANKYHLNEINNLDSLDFTYIKPMGYNSLGELYYLSFKASDILDVRDIVNKLKSEILSNQEHNGSVSDNRVSITEGEDIKLKYQDFSNEIFKDKYSELLALDFINLYKPNNDKSNANFSFLFYAMDSLSLIHCSGTKFREYLEKHNIFIDRIDSKQSSWKSNTRFQAFLLLCEKHKIKINIINNLKSNI